MQHAGPTRRTVLAAGVLGVTALGAAACTGSDEPEPPPRPSADQRLRDQVVTDVRLLAARYAATQQRHPALAPRLGPLAAEHGAHLAALRTVVAPSPVSTPTATPSSTPTPAAPAPAVPGTPAAARRALVVAERAAAARRVAETGRASAVALTRLLASVGACEAAHAALLQGAADE